MEDLDISGLRPEDVREKLAWWRSLWFAIGLLQAILLGQLLFAIGALRGYWALMGFPPPSPWLWALAAPGLALGLILAGRTMRRGMAEDRKWAARLVLKRLRAERMGWGWVAMVGLVMGLYLCALLLVYRYVDERTVTLGESAFFIGVLVGLTPVHFRYRRIWCRAEEIIREVKARADKGGAG